MAEDKKRFYEIQVPEVEIGEDQLDKRGREAREAKIQEFRPVVEEITKAFTEIAQAPESPLRARRAGQPGAGIRDIEPSIHLTEAHGRGAAQCTEEDTPKAIRRFRALPQRLKGGLARSAISTRPCIPPSPQQHQQVE